jgi:hypothetical protein
MASSPMKANAASTPLDDFYSFHLRADVLPGERGDRAFQLPHRRAFGLA